jgi:long-chain-fatty-acid--CoA ligase ACSBG
MSETCGLSTSNTKTAFLWGTVGYPTSGVEIKLFKVADNNVNDKKEAPRAVNFDLPTEDEQGEICFRGRTVMMGYLSNPDMNDVDEITKKTAEVIDDEGWMHSGDKGSRGKHGMIKITGRYKELIIGAGGENVAPVPVEDSVKRLCPAISNAVMIGDKMKYNTMLITLKCEGATGELSGTNVLAGAAAKVTSATTIEEAKADPEYLKVIQAAIDKTNADPNVCQNNSWKVQKYTILPRDLSVENDEFTTTLKLKRSEVVKKWATEIDAMY